MRINKKVLWGYVSEIIAATLIYLLLATVSPQEKAFLLFSSKAVDIATLFAGLMLAATLGFLWSFYAKSDTPFFLWLYSKNAYQVYLTSYIFSAAAFAMLITLLLLASATNQYYLTQASAWMTTYCLLVSISFINNIRTQLILNMEFNKIRQK